MDRILLPASTSSPANSNTAERRRLVRLDETEDKHIVLEDLAQEGGKLQADENPARAQKVHMMPSSGQKVKEPMGNETTKKKKDWRPRMRSVP